MAEEVLPLPIPRDITKGGSMITLAERRLKSTPSSLVAPFKDALDQAVSP